MTGGRMMHWPLRRWVRLGAIVAGYAVLVVAAVQGGRAIMQHVFTPPATQATTAIGGPFEMVDHNGRGVTEKTFLGKPTAMFFGYTFCPDVCPTTLSDLTALMVDLGSQADRLNVVFVSVDPARDTPEHLRDYLSAFDSRFIGLTGTQAQVEQIAKAYRVYYRHSVQDNGLDLIDHTAAVYLMDARGGFVGIIGYQSDQQAALTKLRNLLRT